MSDAQDRLRALFLAARSRWEAARSDEPDADLDAAWSRLEDQLEKPDNAALRREVLGDATGAASVGKGVAGDPLPSLPLVREALRLMEEVYFRLPLGGVQGTAAHRRSLPWLNRFGRWTGAPSFRRWWPWLVPLHASEAIDYLRRVLTLPGVPGPGIVRQLDPQADANQYALRRWRSEEPQDADLAAARQPGETQLFGFLLRFEPPWRDLNAALAVVDWDAALPHIAHWRAQDLYVPPGLWGIGIGEAFLDQLLRRLFARGCRLVQVDEPPEARAGAYWHTLYSGAHFLRRTGHDADGARRTWFERPLTSADAPPDL